MRKDEGFSLLETIIISAVVMVAGAATIPSVINASKQYQLNATAQQINQAIQSAKYDAIRTNSSRTISFDLSTNRLTVSNGTVIQLPSGITFSSLPEGVTPPQSVIDGAANAPKVVNGVTVGITGQASDSKTSCSFPSSSTATTTKLATFTSRGIPDVQPGAYNWVYLKNSKDERVVVTLSSAGSTRSLVRTSDAHWKGTTDSGSIDDTYVAASSNRGTGS